MKKLTPKYYIDSAGAFVIENYNAAKPFCNFLPGIAGLWGVPMWVFYVNRGQCITSFGIESKDKAILEFQPANKAYRLTPLQGFRTLIKIKSNGNIIFYEPFQNNFASRRFSTQQRMIITSHDLSLEEDNITLGIGVRVNYFTLPDEPRAALFRHVSIINTSKKSHLIELIDGLPTIVPSGMTDQVLKNISRTAEAWVQVSNLKERAPYYRLKVKMSDRPQVEHITEGTFHFACGIGRTRGKLLAPIVDITNVFGESQDFSYPEEFLRKATFRLPSEQFFSNRTPSAMCFSSFRLAAFGRKDFVSLSGYAKDEVELNHFVGAVLDSRFIGSKRKRNVEITNEVKKNALTNSSSVAFNQYAGQTFLDNILRGGLPVSLETSEGAIAFNVYSRRHGDPERDYNHFTISATYFSQGNGNYRDVNQNRRNDIWFNPDVKERSLVTFLSLIQADGYNPLVVKGITFMPSELTTVDNVINECVSGVGAGEVRQVIHTGFQPGVLLAAVTRCGVKLSVKPEEFLARILTLCHASESADHGEGYWTDHWAYNLDLLESYLRLYPEELQSLMFNKKIFNFYHDSYYLRPRSEKYVLCPQGVRQYNSVTCNTNDGNFPCDDKKLRADSGRGDVYHTTLAGKLICIIANKAATFDPSGMGLEMEADKPNWYDALNGLPGLWGSSISETIELRRCCSALLKALEVVPISEVSVFMELADFVTGLHSVLRSEDGDFCYWDKSGELKEAYRRQIRSGINGKEKAIPVHDLREWLMLIMQKADAGTRKATEEDLYVSTYFTHEVVDYERLDGKAADGAILVRPLSFRCHKLPLFLEGYVHMLRIEDDVLRAKKIYSRVRGSGLFDRKLKMYKVNMSLKSESDEIGRCSVFPPGWLENESIWLHMEYKYLLEVLRSGLIEEFYDDLKNVLVPFMDPKQYGRSIFENSSFIVSSVHQDKKFHRQGFVARMSGSTAEFLHIWLLINMGSRPFYIGENGVLTLEFRPALAAWLFTDKETMVEYSDAQSKKYSFCLEENTYAFMFLGSTLVVYHNPARKDTFGSDACSVREYRITLIGGGPPIVVQSALLVGSLARDIRARQAKRIDILLR